MLLIMNPEIIAGGMSALKIAFDIIREARASNKDAFLESKLAGLNSVILDLQKSLFLTQNAVYSLQSENLDLQKRITEYEQQRIQSKEQAAVLSKYELKSAAPGVFMYTLKREYRQSQPQHGLCANCVTGGRLSFLQHFHDSVRGHLYRCRNCGEELSIPDDYFPVY